MRPATRARAKGLAKRIAGAAGFELRRVRAATQLVPVGDLRSVLRLLEQNGFESGLAFDVGAFRGEVATRLHTHFGCPVVMVEPLEEMAPILRRLERTKPLTWVAAGASATDGTATIYLDQQTLDGSSIAEHKGPPRTIPTVTLNSLAADHGMPDLVKIDVQGHELAVLDGASELFGRTEVFIIEVTFVRHQGLTQFAEIVESMARRRYVVWDFAGFARRPLDGALGQADVVFVRADGPLRAEGWS